MDLTFYSRPLFWDLILILISNVNTNYVNLPRNKCRANFARDLSNKPEYCAVVDYRYHRQLTKKSYSLHGFGMGRDSSKVLKYMFNHATTIMNLLFLLHISDGGMIESLATSEYYIRCSPLHTIQGNISK